MQKTRLWLMFPARLITRPILWELAKQFAVITNIRQASVTDEIGLVSLELDGEREEIKNRNGEVIKTLARVNEGLCQGCGTCVALCRTKAIDIHGYSNQQVYTEIMALLND